MPSFINDKIPIEFDNNSITYALNKCINCNHCNDVCKNKAGVLSNKIENKICIDCGLCVRECKSYALSFVKNKFELLNIISSKKNDVILILDDNSKCILEKHYNIDFNILIGLFKKIGIKFIFDLNYGHSIHIIKEAKEFLKTIKENKNNPFITSICPSFSKYIKYYNLAVYPYLSKISSHLMLELDEIKRYLFKEYKLDKSLYFIYLSECSSVKNSKIQNFNSIMAAEIIELVDFLRIDINTISSANIDKTNDLLYNKSNYNDLELILKYANYLYCGNFDIEIKYKKIRNIDYAKEGIINIIGKDIKILISNNIAYINKIMPKILIGSKKYDLIHVLGCDQCHYDYYIDYKKILEL